MKSVLILAGGGGHTGYGVMLAEQLHKKAELHFLVPSNDSLSRKLTEKYGKESTYKEKKDDADAMGHSVQVQQQHYVKKD